MAASKSSRAGSRVAVRGWPRVGWCVGLTLAVAVRSQAQPAALDALVTSSDGKPTRLASRWGKPTVLFYEGRDALPLNQEVKDALSKAGRERGLLRVVNVVAVANLEEFNWQPAIFFALEAVKREEAKAGIPVYVDLSGELTRGAWRLPARTSSVLVLSARGELRFGVSGKLSAAQLDELFRAVERELGLPASSARPGGGAAAQRASPATVLPP